MKKIIAFLLVLVISSVCMLSCTWVNGILGKDENKDDGDKNNGGQNDDTIVKIEEDDGDTDTKDNIDPDGWTKVDK